MSTNPFLRQEDLVNLKTFPKEAVSLGHRLESVERIYKWKKDYEKKMRKLLKRGEDALKYHEETTKSERNIMFWRGWNIIIRREVLGE